jgi:adenylate cyclase
MPSAGSSSSLFLFTPFVAQWSIGSFITASGISLWALLAPIGAMLFIGPRESGVWFFAYVFLTVLSGGFDYYLADSLSMLQQSAAADHCILLRPQLCGRIDHCLSAAALLGRWKSTRPSNACRKPIACCKSNRSARNAAAEHPSRAPIAKRLKNSDQTIADGFAEVSVMFADIVNFTRVAEGLTPQQVFAMLNKIFSCLRRTGRKVRHREDQDHR